MTTEPESELIGPLPAVRFENQAFWTGGSTGRLLLMRCRRCAWWIHPPAPSCRRCRSTDVENAPVSGRGRVYSYTVNRQAWFPGQSVPAVIGVVELDEQPGLRLTTQLLACPDDVRIGARAEVRFHLAGDVWLPLFAVVADQP
jgi:uncharacterized protein